MKDITFAPAYVALFAPLAEVARYCGYTLAVHGSVKSDLDLVAIPWAEQAEEPEYLINKLAGVLNVNLNVKDGRGMSLATAEQKPHERLAWALPLGNGAVLDISVLPKEILALRRDYNNALDKIETLEDNLKTATEALKLLKNSGQAWLEGYEQGKAYSDNNRKIIENAFHGALKSAERLVKGKGE